MNMLVRSPAGRCFSSRSSPIIPPRIAASTSLATLVATSPLAISRCSTSKMFGQFIWEKDVEKTLDWPDFITAALALIECPLTRLITAPVFANALLAPLKDCARRLAGGVKLNQRSQLPLLRRLPHRIALESNDVIRIRRWVCQRPFPQPL